MLKIAVISQKGGTGKTTLAINLAVAAERAGQSAVIVDLDPQASAKGWHDHRNDEAPVVVSAQASRLQEVLDAAKQHGAGLVVLDTAPHSESAALAAARAADLVLIPCRPSSLDLRAIKASFDISALAKARAAAVLNTVPPVGPLADQANDAIRSFLPDDEAAVIEQNFTVSPARIGQRIAFVHSLTAGKAALEYEPSGKAAQEIKALYMWACQHASMQPAPTARKTA